MTGPAIVGARFQVEGDDAVVRAIRELSAAMQQAKQTSTSASRDIGAGFIKIGTSAEGATKGARKLETGFADLARSAIGLSGSQSKLVEGLLLLGGGSAAVLGVAAGVALIGLAYRKLTEDATKAREAQDKLLDGLLKVSDARLREANPQATFQEAVTAAEAKAARLQGQLTAAQRALQFATPGELPTRQRDLDQVAKAFADTQRALEQAVITRDEARAKQLAGLRDAGLAKAADLEELQTLRAQAEVTAKLGATDEERLRAANLLKTTAEAEAQGRERSAAATKEQLTAEQQLAIASLKASAKAAAEAQEAARRPALLPNARDTSGRTLEAQPDITNPADVAKRVVQLRQASDARIGQVDPAAIAAQIDAITANADKLLATLDGVKLAVTDVEGEFQAGALNAVEDFFARGITAGESFLDLLRNIVAEFQAIATHALFQQLFGATLRVATAGGGGGAGGSAHDFAEGAAFGFAAGGVVPGSGSGDTVPAMLTPGEGVLTVGQMARLGPVGFTALRQALGEGTALPAIRMGRQYLAGGGVVAASGGGHARLDGAIEVTAGPNTSARVTRGDLLKVIQDNPRAVKQALGIR